jgi:hypothetical protein
MVAHDRMAIHELIHRWWFEYDEGNLDVLVTLAGDIGVSNPLAPFPGGECREAQTACREGAHFWKDRRDAFGGTIHRLRERPKKRCGESVAQTRK